MVTITNMQAKTAMAALQELAHKELNVKPALKVRKLLTELAAHLRDVEDVRAERLRGLAEKDNDGRMVTDNGKAVFETQEAANEFATYYQELMDAEQGYSVTLTVADLGDIQIKPEILMALGPLLIEDET